jgi:FkbM family methyltransferase
MLTSFAQNFEDVMLWRALRHVERGFYIDIGAQDPVIDSVSLGFYEQGWRGVHVEPTPAYAQALRDARPDETVVQAAIGHDNELIPFFEIAGTGISTGDAAIAHRHEAAGYANKRIDVPCIRLSSLLDNYQGRDIHWMKIDVEGMELSVLRSWAPSTVRPWVVVLESTLPLSQELSHAEWESIILGLSYRFAYFDGLNRFYVSEQHLELLRSFYAPPNVFDDFALAGLSSHSFCRRLNESVARARSEQSLQQTELEARRAEYTQREDALTHEAATQAQRANLVLQQLESAKTETLQLLRHTSARDLAHAAELSGAFQDLRAREAQLGEVNGQLDAARSDLAHLKSDLTLQRAAFDASLTAMQRQSIEMQQGAMLQLEASQRQHTMALQSAQAAHAEQLKLVMRLAGSLETQLRAELTTIRAEAHAARVALERVHLSRSWRLTAPLRWMTAGAASPNHPVQEPTATSGDPMQGAAMNSHRQISKVSDVRELLSLHDEGFVRCAYISILHRPVDPSGFAHFVDQVRQGVPKEMVIAELAGSSEGRAQTRDLTGLDELLVGPLVKRSRMGRLFRRLGWLPHQPLASQLRQLDNTLHRMNEASAARLDRIEAEVVLVKQILQRQPVGMPSSGASQQAFPENHRPSLLTSRVVLSDKSPQGTINEVAKVLKESEEALSLSR